MITLVVTHYSGFRETREFLKSMGAEWTEEDIFSNFWGVKFTVKKPTGKGSRQKVKEIEKKFDSRFYSRKRG